MKIRIEKDMERYLVAVALSLVYVILLLSQYILSAVSEGSTINYFSLFCLIVCPLLAQYLLGVFVSIDIRRNLVGWLIIGYTFVYYVCLFLYMTTPKAVPSMQIEGIVFLSEFGRDLFISGFEFVILPAFIFNTTLFYSLKMKNHLIVSVSTTIISLIIFIFFMQIWMG